MKHVAIRYVTHALLKFTRAEIDILMECSKHHYDGVCKSYCEDRPTDGYKWGPILTLSNIHRNTEGQPRGGDDYEHELDFRRIDTMCKCLEMAHPILRGDIERQKVAMELSFCLSKVLKNMNAHWIQDLPVDVPEQKLPKVVRNLIGVVEVLNEQIHSVPAEEIVRDAKLALVRKRQPVARNVAPTT